MKKSLAIILAVMLFCTIFTGCGNAQSETSAADGEKPIRIALMLNGELGDFAFFDSAANGMQMCIDEYGVDAKVFEAGFDHTNWKSTLYDLASEGDWDLIITGTFDMLEIVEEVAKEYPDQKFIHYDAGLDYSTGEYDNVYSVDYRYNKGSFLAGYVAAAISETGNIGMIPAMSIPACNDFALGYVAGARYKNPDIKVQLKYTDDFNDSAKGKELALMMYNNGADIIANGASISGLGIFDAAKETKMLAIGSDADQSALYETVDPEKAATIFTSVTKRIDRSLYRAVGMYLDGTLPFGSNESLGIEDGCIELIVNDHFKEIVPESIQKEVEDVTAKVVNNEIEIPSAYGMTIDEINAYLLG